MMKLIKANQRWTGIPNHTSPSGHRCPLCCPCCPPCCSCWWPPLRLRLKFPCPTIRAPVRCLQVVVRR